jgi:WD40 repeat protein
VATGRGKGYAAFISYNREADRHLAQALQNALHSFAKPWYRLRALRVFRDDAALSANPGLWSAVRNGLDDADYFILLASPRAAASEWVGKEVAHWREHQPTDRILIALTAGEIVWDADAGDFDWTRTTALPPQLRGAFGEEPRYVDLRSARDLPAFSRSRVFRELVADIAAPLHGKDKDELIGEDRRQHRRARSLAIGGVIALAALAVAATLFGVDATRQRDLAEDRLRVATASGLVAQADALRDRDPRTALLLGIAAQRVHEDTRTRASLVETLTTSRYASTLATGEEVGVLAFAPAGRLLATGGSAGTVQLWDVTTRTAPKRVGQFPVGPNDSAAVLSMAFTPDGRMLAVGTFFAGVSLWDVGDPSQPHRYGQALTANSRSDAVALAPDGRMLAVGTNDGTILRYDLTDPAQPKAYPPISYPGGDDVRQLAFARDGRTLTGTAFGGALAAYDLTDPAHPTLRTEPTELGGIYSFLSPDAEHLVTIGDSNDLTSYVFNTPGTPFSFHHPALQPGAYTGAFSADGALVVTTSTDGTAVIWSTDGFGLAQVGKPLVGRLGLIAATAVSNLDRGLVATADADGSVVLWDLGSPARPGARAETIQPPLPNGGTGATIEGIAIAPDGKTVATVDSAHQLLLWDRSDPASLRPLGPPVAGATRPLRFAPDGRLLISDPGVLWDVADRSHPRELSRSRLPNSSDSQPAFSPDGRTLALGTSDGVVLLGITNPAKPTVLGRVEGSAPGRVTSAGIGFSPDSHTLAIGWTDRTASLWNVTDPATPTQLGDPLSGPTSFVKGVAFSPDGQTLAVGSSDGSAILWRVADPARPVRINTELGHRNHLAGLGFAPDGRTLFLSGANPDGSVTMWDLSDADPRQLGAPIVVPEGFIDAFALAPDGLSFAVSVGREIVIWDVTPVYAQRDDPIRFACATTGRGLNPTEWARYVPGLDYQDTCEP